MTPTITNFRSLKYRYHPEIGVCLFEDGTTYTAREMITTARMNLSTETENALHLVKRVFDGEIDTGLEPHKEKDWLAKMGQRFIPPKKRKPVPMSSPKKREKGQKPAVTCEGCVSYTKGRRASPACLCCTRNPRTLTMDRYTLLPRTDAEQLSLSL